MSYKRLTPCIFIDGGKAVRWFDDPAVISDDVISTTALPFSSLFL